MKNRTSLVALTLLALAFGGCSKHSPNTIATTNEPSSPQPTPQAEMEVRQREAQVLKSENNLKQIGMAFIVWAGDHHGQFPFNVSQAQGGTRELCARDSDGFEKNPAPIFMVMSNELSTTKILVCQNDETKTMAADFASVTTNNISYQLRTGTNAILYKPDAILAIDPINDLVLYCDGRVEREVR
jgi:hypothetical protein